MDEDQQDNLDDAFNMYTEAAELCLKLVRSCSLGFLSVCFVLPMLAKGLLRICPIHFLARHCTRWPDMAFVLHVYFVLQYLSVCLLLLC